MDKFGICFASNISPYLGFTFEKFAKKIPFPQKLSFLRLRHKIVNKLCKCYLVGLQLKRMFLNEIVYSLYIVDGLSVTPSIIVS